MVIEWTTFNHIHSLNDSIESNPALSQMPSYTYWTKSNEVLAKVHFDT
jgi:hypothetical protein